MPFGVMVPAPSGGGGGGGAGIELSTVTVSTGNVDAFGDADLSFALLAGYTGVTVVEMHVSLTAGSAGAYSCELYADDARSQLSGYLAGGSFDSISLVGGESYGPALVFSGSPQTVAVPYKNVDGSEFLRATFTNQDGANAGTFDVTLVMLPIA